MDQTNTPNVGPVIDRLRAEAGLSRRQLATQAAIANTTLDRRFREGGFSIPELAKIATVLGVTVSALVAEAEQVAA